MKRLLEYENEDALELLADILDPAVEIFTDTEISRAWNESRVKAVRVAIKKHKKSVIEILARLEGVPVKEYKCNIFTLPATILSVLNDKELLDFFKSQGQLMEMISSGSAMESTEAVAE